MPASFHGRIPPERIYCCKTNMWIRYIDGRVLIGATNFGLHLAGEIVAFTAKPDGAEILRGKGMGTIECHKTVLALHAPVSFRLISGNAEAETHPKLINVSPYEKGWMALGSPLSWDSVRTALCDAEDYKQHILSIDPEARFDD